MDDFSKVYFQKVWGEGYYEHFSYGVGIKTVFERCVSPFIRGTVLEIGSGGGVFTEMIQGKAELIAIDVIRMPERFKSFERFTYYELEDRSYTCDYIDSESINFCFSYNVFCHFSNEAIAKYIESVWWILKPGGDFVFMLAKFERTKKHVDYPERYTLGDLLPMGHFYQDLRTLDLVVGDGWDIVNRDMIPEHRDILIHLKKKYV
jgi:SAM-dependent methyltransferase